jgi:hypothetical protein
LVEDHQSTSSADSLPPPDANVPTPTNAPLLSESVITPVLINNKNSVQAKTPKGEEAFLFDTTDKSSVKYTPWTASNTDTIGHSKIQEANNNNLALEYGLVTAAVVLIMATAGLIATRRKALMEDRGKSLSLDSLS